MLGGSVAVADAWACKLQSREKKGRLAPGAVALAVSPQIIATRVLPFTRSTGWESQIIGPITIKSGTLQVSHANCAEEDIFRVLYFCWREEWKDGVC